MDMHTCPDCGLQHATPGEAAAPVIPEVEIARVQAHRDIEVAKIQARQEADYNETRVDVAEIEAGAELAQAEGQLEGVETVLDAITPDPPADPEPAPEPETVEVEAPPVDDLAPPVTDSAPPEPKRKSIWPYAS